MGCFIICADRERRGADSEDGTADEYVRFNGNDDESLLPPELFGSEFSLEETLQLIDLNEVDHPPVCTIQIVE